MRTSALLLKSTTQILIAILFFFCLRVQAQWVNNPAQNTRIVFDTVDPVYISTTGDSKGGAFLFWEDNKSGFQSDVYFLHIDANGKVSFRSDGKRVSELPGAKQNPVSSPHLFNTAVVIWKDFTRNKAGDLFAQKVQSNGTLNWSNSGLQITRFDKELFDYSLDTDRFGNVYITYVVRESHPGADFRIEIQKITSDGNMLFDSTQALIYKSPARKSSPQVISDESGGAYIFWLESINNRMALYSQKTDSNGKLLWGKKNIAVTEPEQDIISYSVKKINPLLIHIIWQPKHKERDLYHQLLDSSGRFMLSGWGKKVSLIPGQKTNPQVIIPDSSIIVSWTNENNRDKNIYVQKFSKTGKPLLTENGVAVIKHHGDQFGQRLIHDGTGGAIIGWIDRRIDTLNADIYAQRITSKGKLDWDSAGVIIASGFNNPKSYLSIVSDERGGAMIFFKEKREGKNEILAQKIFNTGTFVSHIIGFDAQVEGDSVRISWYAANETSTTEYTTERSSVTDTAIAEWQLVSILYSEGGGDAKFYEHFDHPGESGTFYYRVVQSDIDGNLFVSDVIRVNRMDDASGIVIFQNVPNPFNDETAINFHLPHETKINIEIFNSRVEKVFEQKDVTYPAGNNELVFSADGLSPGIYFYRFRAGDFVEVKKMVIAN